MSNTEPTEEQKQAAQDFVARHGEQNEVIDSGGQARLEWSPTHTANEIAHLLAEREAKLREEVARWRSLVEFHKNNADIQQAEVAKFQRRNAEYERRKAKLDHDIEAYERGRAQSALLSALPLPSDVVAKLLEHDTLRARVAELERPNWLTTPTRSTRSRKDRLKEARERETALTKRVAELEEERVASIEARRAVDQHRREREAQHLANIKALRAKRLVDMREVARWGAELAWNADDNVVDTKIAADIMEEFATFDAEDELLQRLAHDCF